MKHGVCSLILALLSISTMAQQPFNAGVKLGFSATQINGDGFAGFNKVGVASGLFVSQAINDKMDWSMDMLYFQKGSRQKADAKNGNTFLKISLDYVEVPVAVSYLYKKIKVEAYLAGGVLFRNQVEDEIGTIPATYPYKKFELSGGVGLKHAVSDKLDLAWRLGTSLLPIQNSIVLTTLGFRGGSYNRFTTFSLNYKILN